MNTKKERNYGIDLLRMLAMCMVAVLHILGHGGVLESIRPLSLRYEAAWLIEIACYCAVNCYALISGYVGINSRFKITNLIMLWFQVVFYSFGITLLFQFVSPETVTLKQILVSLLPVTAKQYWYFNAYVCLFLFIPFINETIKSLSAQTLKHLVLCMILLLSILPTLSQKDLFSTNGGYSALWLIFVYLLGAYLNRYDFSSKHSCPFFFIIYLSGVLITWMIKWGAEYINASHGTDVKWGKMLISYTSPTILLCSIALLYLFSKIKLNNLLKKIVMFFSPATFGVYLIHEHPLIRANLFSGRFSTYCSLPPIAFLLAIPLTAISIFIFCCCIDTIRIKLFKLIGLRQKLEKIKF